MTCREAIFEVGEILEEEDVGRSVNPPSGTESAGMMPARSREGARRREGSKSAE